MEKLQKGLTLLETLLVLVVIAAIITFSINRFRAYQRRIETVAIKNDIATLKQHLNVYFHEQGCYSGKGKFAGKSKPSLTDINFNHDQHEPVISQYAVKIVKASIHTMNNNNKSYKNVYHLEVKATLNSSLSQSRQKWYQQEFGASTLQKGELTWIMLPKSNVGEAAWFKKRNGLDQSEGDGTVSPSYCAH